MKLDSLDELDPELRATYDKLGISLLEQKRLNGIAVDAVFDSVSVATTFKAELEEAGHHLLLLLRGGSGTPGARPKYLGSVVPYSDNFFACLNAAVFSDGSFAYIPKGVRCPMELSTYFRINAAGTGQFERTLLVADERRLRQLPRGLHGSAARRESAARRGRRARRPRRRRDQVLDGAELVSRRRRGRRRDLQLRDQARRLPRRSIEDLLDPGRDRLGHHLEVSRAASCSGDDSVGEFYSVAVTNNRQQADTGTKMIHIGKNTKSTIISKGISAGRGDRATAGWSRSDPRQPTPATTRQCDSLLIGDRCGAHTFPYLESQNPTATVEHEATTSKIGEDQLFFCRQRGIEPKKTRSR